MLCNLPVPLRSCMCAHVCVHIHVWSCAYVCVHECVCGCHLGTFSRMNEEGMNLFLVFWGQSVCSIVASGPYSSPMWCLCFWILSVKMGWHHFSNVRNAEHTRIAFLPNHPEGQTGWWACLTATSTPLQVTWASWGLSSMGFLRLTTVNGLRKKRVLSIPFALKVSEVIYFVSWEFWIWETFSCPVSHSNRILTSAPFS